MHGRDNEETKDVKTDAESGHRERGGRDQPYGSRSLQHFNNASMTDDESCPLGCKAKHLLASCPVYQGSTVNQRWEIERPTVFENLHMAKGQDFSDKGRNPLIYCGFCFVYLCVARKLFSSEPVRRLRFV